MIICTTQSFFSLREKAPFPFELEGRWDSELVLTYSAWRWKHYFSSTRLNFVADYMACLLRLRYVRGATQLPPYYRRVYRSYCCVRARYFVPLVTTDSAGRTLVCGLCQIAVHLFYPSCYDEKYGLFAVSLCSVPIWYFLWRIVRTVSL
jgi:hypothetical protein